MSIRKFRKQMKPFIIILTVVFILSLAYGGYESYRTSRANKKAQEELYSKMKELNLIIGLLLELGIQVQENMFLDIKIISLS